MFRSKYILLIISVLSATLTATQTPAQSPGPATPPPSQATPPPSHTKEAPQSPKKVAPTLDLSVGQCRDLALNHDPYANNAELDVLAARAQKQEALSEYFPRIEAQAFAFYAFNPLVELGLADILGESEVAKAMTGIANAMASKYGVNTVYSALKSGISATVSATQPIFAGGRIYHANKLAALGVQAAMLKRDIQVRTTGEDVESSYWNIVSLEEKLGCIDEAESFLNTLYDDVSAAIDAGVVTDTDLMQVQLKINELKADKILLTNGIRLAKMDLCNRIGVKYNPYTTVRNDSIPYIDDIRLTDRPENLPAPAEYYVPEAEVAANQEETKLLDMSVESKRIEKKMTLGEALPQLGVGVSYGYGDIINKGSMNGAVYGVLKIPISDWGKTSRKMQRMEYQIQKAENEREYLQSQLVLQIHKLWTDLTAAYEKWQVAEESAATVEAVERQMHENYLAGMVTISELLQVRTELTEAKSKILDSKIDYNIALGKYLERVEN